MSILIAFLLSCAAWAEMESTLESITVTPDMDKQNVTLVHATGSLENSDQTELKKRIPVTLKDAADGIANVEFTGGPRTQAQLPQIRGLNSDRILILEDGVRQNFQTGHNGRTFGDYSLLENLEVVKGPWSSLYGSGAMGGAINYRRAIAADFIRRFKRDSGFQAALDGGTAAGSRGERLTGFAKVKEFEGLFSFRDSDSQDIRHGDGTYLPYSGSKTHDVYSALTYRPGERQNFTLKLNRFEDRARVPLEPDVEINPLNLICDQATLKEDLVGDYNVGGGKWDFHAKPYYRRTAVHKTRLSDARLDKQIVGTAGVDTWNNWRFSPAENLKFAVTTGVEYFRDHNKGERDGGSLASFPNGTSDQLGLYFQPTTTWRKLTLTPGLRYDSYSVQDASGGAKSAKAANVSVKLYADYEYQPERHVFTGWGQAFNAPRMQDLYASGAHFPGNFFIPNPDLKPERADTLEAGVKNSYHPGEDQLLTLNAVYFRTEARDFINRSVDIGAGTTQLKNLDRVHLEGVELSAIYFRTLWGATLTYGQVRSLDKGTGEPLPDTAADQLSASVQFFAGDELHFGSQARVALKQSRVPTGTETSPGYFVQDFFVTYSPGSWELRFRVDNAFDRNYRPHTSAIKAAGRDARFAVSYTF